VHKEVREIVKQVEAAGFTVIHGGTRRRPLEAELLADLRRRGIIE
jgi:hypothetical protein